MQEKLSSLLQQTVESYKNVHLESNRRNPDWVHWYARWLLMLSDIRDILELDLTQEALEKLLLVGDAKYSKTPATLTWAQFVSREITGIVSQYNQSKNKRSS